MTCETEVGQCFFRYICIYVQHRYVPLYSEWLIRNFITQPVIINCSLPSLLFRYDLPLAVDYLRLGNKGTGVRHALTSLMASAELDMSSRNKPSDLKPSKSLPRRPRHQIKRSSTEPSSPSRHPENHSHHRNHHSRGEQHNAEIDPVSPNSTSRHPRVSADLARSRGTTSPYPAIDQDRGESFLSSAPHGISTITGTRTPQPYESKEGHVLREREKMAPRTTFVGPIIPSQSGRTSVNRTDLQI